jgi:hypothetical protein
MVATVSHILENVCKNPNLLPSRFTRIARRYFTDIPLAGTRHANPIPLLGRYVNIKTPLRMEAFFLAMLFAANLVSIFGFYSPYTTHNLL